ncbi:MAG: 2-hydroxychromene-2-carboxylate isomerase [Zoogloeaceae bacterium]|nr:2-hydroxychromene-2-carboxylate isomerase [Zoogloeaceae bacterium]
MRDPIDFYFDFSSPYGYFAAERIDGLASRYERKVVWHPILLGVTFKVLGTAPLPSIPVKGPYSLRDIQRTARYLEVLYRPPSRFPIATQQAGRAFTWLADRSPDVARQFALAAFRAYFTEDRDLSDLGVVLAVAGGLGVDTDELSAALAGDELKARFKSDVEAAVARGVFGSPFFIVDGEPFWGSDRLPQLEKWLAEGGF